MRRALWLNALLAAAVAALAAWVWLKPQPAGAPVAHRLSELDRSSVQSLLIEGEGHPPLALARKGGEWFVTAPFSARASAPRVGQLLDILDTKTLHRLDALQLERFELDAPRRRLTVSANGGKQTFAFGLVNAVTREQYVLTRGAVYAVSPRHGAALPAQAADVISTRLFASGEIVERIELPAFSVERQGDAWRQSPPSPHPTQTDYARWMEGWQQAAAARVEPYERGRPREEVRVRLKGGTTLTLGIVEREPHVVLLRPDEKLKYYFRGEAGMRLLARPGAALAAKPVTGER